MQQSADTEFNWIELDDRPPKWGSLAALLAVIAILIVLVAPWMVQLNTEDSAMVASPERATTSVCRPETDGLPRFLNPSIASWNRFCEWFIEPGNNSEKP